jgi:6-phosphogluconolactonase (cycloisomerase 2 family)
MQPLNRDGTNRLQKTLETKWFPKTAALLASAIIVGATATVAHADRRGGRASLSPGAVFVGTNHNNTSDPSQPANQVAVYRRAANGTLSLVGHVNTGGQGSGPGQRFAGDGLGSAHSVELSQDRRFLFVTNAGSNNVSVFRVSKNGLALTDLEPTGDGSPNHRFPNSVTQNGDLVYVLNGADQGSITGFRLSKEGTLSPIPGSTRLLAANQDRFAPDALKNPTQVSFTPGGRQIVVTIKDGPPAGALPGPGNDPTGPGRVLVFSVGRDGLPSTTFTQTNLDNRGPFGFSFDQRGNLLTSLFVGGPNGTAAAGSFRINGTARSPESRRSCPTPSWTPAGWKTTGATPTARTTGRAPFPVTDRQQRQFDPASGHRRHDRAPRQPNREPRHWTLASAPTASSCTTCCPAPAKSPAGASTATAA